MMFSFKWLGLTAVMFGMLPVVQAGSVRNIILCIGDGVGPQQQVAAEYFQGAALFMKSLPYATTLTTDSANSAITDSAAAATAMATGASVNNGVISVALPGGGGELETVLEYFQVRGKSSGLVTSTYITHATPAAFGAHNASRGNYADIASDYLNQTRPEVLLGGGGFGMDVGSATSAGYTVVTNRADLMALDPSGLARLSGQFGLSNLPYEVDGLNGLPSLTDMTSKALAILEGDPDGFFLMVEGGRIDHAGHANDLARCIGEVLAFDQAVETVMGWASGREDTLVIITADHETGGLNVTADNGAGNLPTATWSTGGHTATPVPVYGWGLHADSVTTLTHLRDVQSLILQPATVPEKTLSLQQPAPGALQFTSTSASGDVYQVESATMLTPPDWAPHTTVTASSHRLTLTATNLTDEAVQFFRVMPVF